MTGVLVQRDDERQDCRAPSSSLYDSHLDSRTEQPWQLWGWTARTTSRDLLVYYDLKVLEEASNMSYVTKQWNELGTMILMMQ